MDAKNDRAEQRRQKVGSSCDHEKTKSASLNTYVVHLKRKQILRQRFIVRLNFLLTTIYSSISNENKGFKMLKSLGWSEGQALGKNEDGLLEPVC